MSNIRSVFSLEEVNLYKLSGDWPTKGTVGLDGYGYFGGGGVADVTTVYSIVDRLDYANDTRLLSARGSLSVARADLSSIANSNYGYFAGGVTPAVAPTLPTNYSIIDRIDYANDTTVASLKNLLSIARFDTAAVSTQNYGYFGGGYITSPSVTIYSTLERLNYSNDASTLSPRGPLSIARHGLTSVGDENYGYFTGGIVSPTNTSYSFIERLDYSNDTSILSYRGNLNAARGNIAATGNSSYGYFAGGISPASSPVNVKTYSLIERIDYSNDGVNASSRSSLNSLRHQLSATGSRSYGYFAGGVNIEPTRLVSNTDRIDYSSDTSTPLVRGALSTARAFLSANSGAQSYTYAAGTPQVATSFAYFGGGATGSSKISRFDYSADLGTTNDRSTLPISVYQLAALSSPNYGYFLGGLDSGPNPDVERSSIFRIDYSNDTTNPPNRAVLSTISRLAAATGNANFGYYGGGYFSPPVTQYSTVERIGYANDLAILVIRGPLSSTNGNYYHSATGNTSYGYFNGGYNNTVGVLSTIDRIDYANDTLTASPRGLLTVARYTHSSTGNANYGYFAGYETTLSSVDRLEYVNDTVNSVSRGSLSVIRGYNAATGNGNYGYVAGGYSPNLSSIDRIDYTNDTAKALTRGSLSAANYYFAIASAAANGLVPASPAPSPLPTTAVSYGYFAGGFPALTSIDRVDYNNDSAVTLTRGSLNLARGYLAATSSPAYGWFAGGYTPTVLTMIDRLDYSTDTTAAAPRNTLALATYALGGTGNSSYGWFGGGFTTAAISSVNRLDYANDTTALSPRGALQGARYGLSATGNTSYGWFGGGILPAVSSVDRIDYASDTVAASPRGALTFARSYLGATGNANFGYFGGGVTPAPATFSVIDRVTYTSDTVATSPRGPLQVAQGNWSATGNGNYGYFGSSLIYRIDYSNDGVLSPSFGGLKVSRNFSAATSAASNGLVPAPTPPTTTSTSFLYISGGYNPSITSRIERMEYANDLAICSDRAKLPLDMGYHAGISNNSYGWFTGGYNPTIHSRVDRIDYSNDTAATSPRGNLTLARYGHGVAGNTSFGWNTGGYTTAAVSTVDRIQYSNDTAAASPRGNLSLAKYYFGYASNLNYGWMGAGYTTTAISSVDRIDYANDTATASPRTVLPITTYANCASGNNNFGWWVGGATPVHSAVTRIDYSNDTFVTTKVSLAGYLYNASGVGNNNFGYITGGYNYPASVYWSTITRIDYNNDNVAPTNRGFLTSIKYLHASTSAASNGLT